MGGPANDGKLRPGNIQGFEILQWRSFCSSFGGSGYHTSGALTTRSGRVRQTASPTSG